ncbi:MAG: ribbon-helix-helix domain-containing protein [Candidatus Woesearchaeota archaeon]
MDVISLKLDEGMLKQIDGIVKTHHYGTRTEFIRSSIREKMTQLEKDTLIKQIMSLKGSVKTTTSNKELRSIREKVSEELLKEYHLK